MKISRKSVFYRIANWKGIFSNNLSGRFGICKMFWRFFLNIIISFPILAVIVLCFFGVAAMLEIVAFGGMLFVIFDCKLRGKQGKIKLSGEHTEYKWLSLEKLAVLEPMDSYFKEVLAKFDLS